MAAMAQHVRNISVLFLVCDETEDVDRIRKFIGRLKRNGISDIYSTTDYTLEDRYSDKLQAQIRIVQKIMIVLSKQSSRINAFKRTIACTMSLIVHEPTRCTIVPLLLDNEVEMPFLLQCNDPYLLCEDDDGVKLIRSLYFISDEQAITGIVKLMINLYTQINAVRKSNTPHLLPDSALHDTKALAMSYMHHWGVFINDKCLTVDMNRLHNCASYERLCLDDLFRCFNSDDAIRVIRATGVTKCNLFTLFKNGQLYDDLVTIFNGIFEAATKDKQYRYWYQYRRNGLFSADRAELAFKPLIDARAKYMDGKLHSPEFKTYESRLRSLAQFPIKSERVRELIAEAGCFSVNHIDYIQCYECGACLRVWNIAASEHSFYFEHCALREKKKEISEKIRSKEFRDQLVGDSFDNPLVRYFTFTLLSNLKEYNVTHLEQFAEAGFYYLGTKEDILCYSCYLGLTNIKEHQDPLEVHYRFSPNCKHLNTLNDNTRRQYEMRKESCNNSDQLVPYLEVEIMLYK
ncbi:uncharacterized protein [Mytilus edulis]|uniref:uncharacterized protein n=1 Tax=Mytilus edulis TaxID=6550 RepID=UPI0039EFEAEF